MGKSFLHKLVDEHLTHYADLYKVASADDETAVINRVYRKPHVSVLKAKLVEGKVEFETFPELGESTPRGPRGYEMKNHLDLVLMEYACIHHFLCTNFGRGS